MPVEWRGSLLVVGAGLIGTSVGLAARRAGADVWLTDRDAGQARLAESLGAGTAIDGAGSIEVDVALVAVSPASTGQVAAELLRTGVGTVVSHVCSVQAQPQAEVEAKRIGLDRFVGGHPIAGREIAGPAGADAALFRDRPWVLCPSPATDPDAVAQIRTLVLACGATPVVMTAEDHDRALARVSHVPQLVASALAASLLAADPARVQLAGSGLRDTTRLADSSPQMWAEIVAANASAVAAALREVATPLTVLADGLEAHPVGPHARELVETLLQRGRAGRHLLPGKHGGAATPLAGVHVVVSDEPGTLARLLADVSVDGINVEDLRVEHAPGQPLGVVELLVAPADQQLLVSALGARGWTAGPGTSPPGD